MTGRTTSTSFVGREEELRRLQRGLHSAAAGQPGTLLIAGEAGVGKTRLVHEFANRVGDEAQVLFGSCIQLSRGGLPYGPIVDALRPLARNLDPAALNELLGSTPDDLLHLLPVAIPRRPRRSAEPVSEYAHVRLFEFFLGFLDRLGRQRPVVLVVEDAHWADRSTLDLLIFLIRMAHQERLLVLATYRSDELHSQHPLRAALVELDRSWHLEHLELTRFDRAELAALLGTSLAIHPRRTRCSTSSPDPRGMRSWPRNCLRPKPSANPAGHFRGDCRACSWPGSQHSQLTPGRSFGWRPQ